MAEREAAIRLTLDDGQFVAGMAKAGDAAVKSAQRSEKAMQVFGAGVKKATGNLGEMASMARSSLGMVSGLLGGLTFGSALKGAVELDSKFKALAFNVSRVTKEQVKAADIQKTIEQAAITTGRRTSEMADVFGELFQATGDAEFTADMLTKIGVAATATNADIGSLTKLADQLHTKFGVASEDMLDLFSQMHGMQQGGNSVAEVAAIIDTLGAEMLNAGLKGKQGIGFMLNALAVTEDPLGGMTKQVKGIRQLLLSLGDSGQITRLAKALHIDPKKLLNEKDLIGRLKRVLSMGPRGVKALQDSMTESEEQKALKYIFIDPFESALKRAQDAGLKGKAANDAALAELDAGIRAFGDASGEGAKLVREAADRRQDPERRLTAALDTLQRSFGDPKIIEAIEELSKYLPQIAEAFGKFAKFAVQSPILAATLGIGAKAGGGFMQGAITEAITDAFTGGGRSGGASGGRAAGGAAALAGSLIERHHQFGSEGISEAQMIENSLERGGEKAGSAIQTAMQLGAVASAAAWAYQLGKEQIGRVFDAKAEATGNLSAVGASTASMRGGLEKQKADADALRAALAKARAERGGFVSTFFGAMAHGGGAGVDEMGNPTGEIDASASGMPDLEGTMNKQIEEMEQQLKAKEARIAELEIGDSDKATGQQLTGIALARAIKAGDPLRVEVVNQPATPPAPGPAGPGGSRGPKRPAAQASGSGL